MKPACLNRIGTAVPPHDIHVPFIAFARTLLGDDRTRLVFDRMAERAGIEHRWSLLRPGNLAAGRWTPTGSTGAASSPAPPPGWRCMSAARWNWPCRPSPISASRRNGRASPT